jgi:arabinofuranosyltransferase
LTWLRLLPALLAFLLRLIPGPRIVDDAFITFRYARNLTTGAGLVFNPGELVLGTTTPLYTFLLASLSTLLGIHDLPVLAWLLNALIDVIGVTITGWLGKRLTGSRAVGIGAALLWAAAPYSVTFAIGGLETSLVITLLLGAFALYLTGRERGSAFLLGLATLTRPDVLIAAALIFAGMGWPCVRGRLLRRPAGGGSGPSFPVAPAVTYLLTLAPWLVFAIVTYGSPLPNSIAAKSVAYHLPREAALVRLVQHAATPFHEHLLHPQLPILGILVYPALFAAGALHVTRSDRRAWPLFVYPAAYAAVYALANPLIFRWYLSPPVPFYFLGILAGMWALVGLVPAVVRPSGRRASLVAGASVLALAMELNAWTSKPPGPPPKPAPEMAWIELETLYRQVAADVAPELRATGGRLAAGDIGVLGWYTGAPILDLVGLISPQASEYYPLADEAYVINYAVSPDLVLDERPEMVVILEAYGRNTLAVDADFRAAYELWREYPSDIYGSTSMQVYRLRAF